MSPGAEMMVLHLYVLGGGDRLANFAQWFAMVVCLVGAARIAGSLGATGAGQWLAGLFVVTLPMGIAQSSSTMTDYIVALWVTCAVAEAVEVIVSGPSRANMITMPVAAGLAVLDQANRSRLPGTVRRPRRLGARPAFPRQGDDGTGLPRPSVGDRFEPRVSDAEHRGLRGALRLGRHHRAVHQRRDLLAGRGLECAEERKLARRHILAMAQR